MAESTNGRVTLREVYSLLKEMQVDIEKTYVSRQEFLPIKNIVYGMVGLILLSVATALVASVVKAWVIPVL